MDVPEIAYDTSLESTPWKNVYSTHPVVKYIDHLTSYEDFFKQILLKNQLCVIGPHVTSAWASRVLWVMPDGSPNFAYLLEKFGEAMAPVADCNSEEFCAHSKTEMTVKEYLTYWQSYRLQGHCQSAKCLYLKDWHLVRDYPGYHGYHAPSVLCSDWMNEFWDVRKDQDERDDYRFVYMGPKHSWTPFHADVLHSYSWSANICGKKKWIFYPPGEERNLKDKHGHLVFDLRSPDLQDLQKYPNAASAAGAAITVIQNPGEIIFVPSGWHHQVFNLEDTISINHNWMNGCSAHLSWEYIKKRLLAVQKEIEDCKGMEGWHQQCQVILKADSGMDYLNLYSFVATIAVHRMNVLNLILGGGSSRTGLLGFSRSLRLGASSSCGVSKSNGGDDQCDGSSLSARGCSDGSSVSARGCSDCSSVSVKDCSDGSSLTVRGCSDGSSVSARGCSDCSSVSVKDCSDGSSLTVRGCSDGSSVSVRDCSDGSSGSVRDCSDGVVWSSFMSSGDELSAGNLSCVGTMSGCGKDVIESISRCGKDDRSISGCRKDVIGSMSGCGKDDIRSMSRCGKDDRSISGCGKDDIESRSGCGNDRSISGCRKDVIGSMLGCEKDDIENMLGCEKDDIENMLGCEKDDIGNMSRCGKDVIGIMSGCGKDDIGSLSGCDKDVGRISYFCLFKGEVVEPCMDGGDLTEHRECPHWAHCGPNLAMFDLRQVLSIVQDMMGQVEFKAIVEAGGCQEALVISPSELVWQVGCLVSQGESL